MTPEQIAKSGSEHAEQTAIFCWANLNREKYPELEFLFAIPNGGARDEITGGRLKAEGVKPGVPDIFLPVARGQWHGLWIELKKIKKGKASKEQEYWMTNLRNAGYGACVCKGWQDATEVIKNYLEFGQ